MEECTVKIDKLKKKHKQLHIPLQADQVFQTKQINNYDASRSLIVNEADR